MVFWYPYAIMGASLGQILVGVDVGSTTVKAAAIDAQSHELLAAVYLRHHAHQLERAVRVLEEIEQQLEGRLGARRRAQNSQKGTVPFWLRIAVTGSGGKDLAAALGVPYVQEVIANSIAVAEHYPQARVAIELGGQDAKMVFFEPGFEEGTLKVSDMRMNGSCAGGTGAFLDEIATLLKIPVEELDAYAARGTTLYSISGRCGVFAKTDIQPLINQGAAKEDIALSTFHAVAKQTLGGLAQGLEVIPPVIFEGGPLTFNSTLVRVFIERLQIEGADVIIPDQPEIIVARGAALALQKLFGEEPTGELADGKSVGDGPADDGPAGGSADGLADNAAAHLADGPAGELADGPAGERQGTSPSRSDELTFEQARERIARAAEELKGRPHGGKPFFATDEECAAFRRDHALAPEPAGPAAFERGQAVDVFLGIDSGSTTTKFALVDEDGALIDSFYANNEGEPLDVAKEALAQLDDRWRAAGVQLNILGCATTGYGELLFARAFHADCHVVETVAHALAAARMVDDVTFILDIGGQDMKAIWVDDGIVTDILVNEACSSGCGSFLENFAHTLGIPTRGIADAAFRSPSPAELGSRCTVFMNSSVVTEQKNGKSPDDIMAGLCRSIIENVFTKVIRLSNLDRLGERIVVQGGTFANDAVLAAFEAYVGRPVTRAPYPGLMGAIGAALFAQRNARQLVEDAPAGHFVDADWSRADARPTIAQHVSEKAEIAPADDAQSEPEGGAAAQQRGDSAEHELHGTPASQHACAPHRGGQSQRQYFASSFIGLAAARDLAYEQQANVTCPFCTNNCARSVITFSDGSTFVTGNRCERGEVVGDPRAADVRDKLRAAVERKKQVPNLFDVREKLLFKDYAAPRLANPRGITIGLPRVLAFWDTMPFWTTFWRSLGFAVRISHPSSRAMFENGLPAVASDTICFPAKLVHGHVRDLERARVDRIFMPSITTVPTENTEKTSESMCAVVKGYAIVMRNSDNPAKRANLEFDAPLFHWYSDADRERQMGEWMSETFGISADLTRAALAAADAAQQQFRDELLEAGRDVLARVRRDGTYAVVLASRPYHNDPLVNHDLPDMFTALGIPVLPPDAIPGTGEVDLSRSRLDIVNNYHARMLACAIISAEDPNLEYAQVVSFGCGHDAYLSDEIVRLTHEITDKSPLILKVDESDVPGPLRIRIRSFVETINIKRAERTAAPTAQLGDPYAVKYRRADRKRRVVLVPNTSHAFSRLMAAVFSKQGLHAVPVPIGREEAIRLGKQYVHNDICFPAQIVIGECLAELRTGKYDDAEVAVATGKYIGDCRLTHYGALLRKALDDAGYAHVPIVTNDDVDYHNLHPGFKISVASAARVAMGLPMIDALEELLRKMRPYELVPGSANAAFERAMDQVMEGFERHGAAGARRGFARAIDIMREVEYDRSELRPRVLIVGEYLLNFHPGANHDVEDYLERNGFEIIEAKMTDVIRKTYFYKGAQIAEYGVNKPFSEATWYKVANALFEHAHDVCDRIASAHPLYEPACRMPDLVVDSDPIIHHTFDAGEGVLIPGEIIHHANHGCEAFLILQPFGCLPNHIVGRGIVKRLRELYPSAQILSLDYDPDVSFANVENRLQMLVMNVRESHEHARTAPPVDLGAVAETVDAVTDEVDELVEEVLAASEAYAGMADGQVEVTPETIEETAGIVRQVLEREDRLAALAKNALVAARKAAYQGASGVVAAAQRGAGDAADVVRQGAGHVADAASRGAGHVADAAWQGATHAAEVAHRGASDAAEVAQRGVSHVADAASRGASEAVQAARRGAGDVRRIAEQGPEGVRDAVKQGAGDAVETVTARALAVYELAREMRTRTHGTLSHLSELADGLRDSGGEALTHAQSELAARVNDGRAFADRVRRQVEDLRAGR